MVVVGGGGWWWWACTHHHHGLVVVGTGLVHGRGLPVYHRGGTPVAGAEPVDHSTMYYDPLVQVT